VVATIIAHARYTYIQKENHDTWDRTQKNAASTVTNVPTQLRRRKQLAAATRVIQRYRMDKRGRRREPLKILERFRTLDCCSINQEYDI